MILDLRLSNKPRTYNLTYSLYLMVQQWSIFNSQRYQRATCYLLLSNIENTDIYTETELELPYNARKIYRQLCLYT